MKAIITLAPRNAQKITNVIFFVAARRLASSLNRLLQARPFEMSSRNKNKEEYVWLFDISVYQATLVWLIEYW